MWRPWSRALELLGRLRLPVAGLTRHKGFRVGRPDAPDARGSHGWRVFLSSERLFDVWGPHPDGPWAPFHCVPLFAALDTLEREKVGPSAGPEPADAVEPQVDGARALPAHARPGAPPPPWLTGETWTILDLPGPLAVEAGVWLVEAGCQPVCAFDNWPHPKGILPAEWILAELLRWATTMNELRTSLEPTAPPLWICDSQRLGSRNARPGEFDNRYFLDDSILPGIEMLRRHAVKRVMYLTLDAEPLPVPDLEACFAELLEGGIMVFAVDLGDPAMEPRVFAAPRTPRRIGGWGFRRSGAGGFGSEVPEPSSGSSG